MRVVREARIGPSITTLALVGLAWATWGAVHSALATRAVKERVCAGLTEGGRVWRLVYNGIASATLLGALAATWVARGPVIWGWAGWRPVQVALVLGAGLLFVTGARGYDMLAFLGLRQLGEGDCGDRPAMGALSTHGVHGLVRHPWYLGVAMLLWGLDLPAAGVVAAAVLTAYLGVGTLLEERRLARELGPIWEDYAREVPMLVPWRAAARYLRRWSARSP